MTEQMIAKLIQSEKELQGADYVDMRPVLERTLTAGELLAALQGVDPDLPLVLEIAAGRAEDGSLGFDSAYLLNVFETGEGVARLVLSGAVPEVSAAYIKEEEL